MAAISQRDRGSYNDFAACVSSATVGRRGTNFGVLRSALIEDAGEDGLVDGQERSLLKGLLVRLTCRSTAEIMIRQRRRPDPNRLLWLRLQGHSKGTNNGWYRRLPFDHAGRPIFREESGWQGGGGGRVIYFRPPHANANASANVNAHVNAAAASEGEASLSSSSLSVAAKLEDAGNGGGDSGGGGGGSSSGRGRFPGRHRFFVRRWPRRSLLSNCWVLDVAIRQVGSPISASLSPHLLPEEPGVRWTSPTGGWVELPVRTSFLVENAKNQVNQSNVKIIRRL